MQKTPLLDKRTPSNINCHKQSIQGFILLLLYKKPQKQDDFFFRKWKEKGQKQWEERLQGITLYASFVGVS